MKKFPGLLVIMGLLFILALLSVEDEKNTLDRPEPSAPISETVKGACTNVWLTGPSYYEKISAGTKRCLTLKDSGWIYTYRADGSFLDYVSPYTLTKTPPHSGDGSSTARYIKALAAKYNVKLQFASVDYMGRPGCNRNGFYDSMSGSYQSLTTHPGKGLVRLGTGRYKSCISKYPTQNKDLARHEITHAIVERKCEGRNIYREEYTTDAYAYRYLGAGKAAGNYGFTRSDLARAIKVHAGQC